jgi:hypothetical protein
MRLMQHEAPPSSVTTAADRVGDAAASYAVRIHGADDLAQAYRLALQAQFRLALAGLFDSQRSMDAAYFEWANSAAPSATHWGMALGAARSFVLADHPRSDDFAFEVERVYELH